MIVSYKWLQTYFKDKLPTPDKVSEAFTFGAFEVEGMEQTGGNGGEAGSKDTAFDLKVLPDRACYALSHRGVAYELAAITGQKSTASFDGTVSKEHAVKEISEAKVQVNVDDKKLCLRYCARYIKNISVGNSPLWLCEMLEGVGQRSINTIVDVTNFVMLDMGQPLHAFDADKVQGGIVVRLAKAGEIIELLPEKNSPILTRNIALQETDLIIADDLGPIAIAGVKGGIRTAVTDDTKNLIIESANFDAVTVRKTSTRLALRNDASKRFENNLPIDFAGYAIEEVAALIKKLCPDASIGSITDIFSKPAKPVSINVSLDFISTKLGIELIAEQVEEIFTRLLITFEKKNDSYLLTIPPARLDLITPEDMVEEVGRIYGYDKIPPAIPKKVSKSIPVNQTAYWTEKIKDVLFELGYSEVQTSSFATKGEIEIQNPLASDKKFVRKELYTGLMEALERNGKNSALFGSDEVKIFEIGTVFGVESEHFSLAVGAYVGRTMKKKDEYITGILDSAFKAISEAVGMKIQIPKLTGQTASVVEINLSEMISSLKKASVWDINNFTGNIKYKPFSLYPFMVRDVAVFVPTAVREEEVSEVISTATGALKIRQDLFDVFTKKFEGGEEKTSYAFHIVFQSHERTLVEEEVNTIMKNVSDALTAKSWQVR